jgi:hypothetical protein
VKSFIGLNQTKQTCEISCEHIQQKGSAEELILNAFSLHFIFSFKWNANKKKLTMVFFLLYEPLNTHEIEKP